MQKGSNNVLLSSFIQKYKPYYVDDFCIDVAKKRVIQTLLAKSKANLLLVGTTATGKTTFLYALIREYYGLGPQDKCSEQDVLFINNLKEQQGISYFRNEMKTFCQTRLVHPRGCKKMIVIDDMDTIHQQCQQVLCNYIDKYSGNIQFVFSCSNAQKIIENVQSRVQIVGLEPPTRGHLEQLYRRIVEEEGLQGRMDVGVESFVLDLAQGSLREVINIMEKVVVFFGLEETGLITEAECRDLFLTRIQTSFQALLVEVRKGGLQEGIELMLQIVSNGYSIVDIFDAFFKFVKGTDLLSETEKYEAVRILCQYITIIHTMHEEKIEIVLFVNGLYKLLYQKQK